MFVVDQFVFCYLFVLFGNNITHLARSIERINISVHLKRMQCCDGMLFTWNTGAIKAHYAV